LTNFKDLLGQKKVKEPVKDSVSELSESRKTMYAIKSPYKARVAKKRHAAMKKAAR
jgi:hypothetical protein